ncbi:MAG: FlgO family outer membrane protein, partial [Gemmatimonadota bacterium]|nr:FlgO family outer membrane protein [Gemmatimonadota bacterium]
TPRGTVAPTPMTATVAPAAAAASVAPSIAVLPLVNLGRDSADQYFADGMSEEITSKLAKVRGLRVASRTAAISVRGKAASVGEIGKMLNVATLLEGTMQRDKNRLRITARLVNVADGFTLWSDVYERDPKDIFSVQDEISQAIVVALGAELHTTPTAADTATKAVAPAAYNEYLLGRFFFAKRGDAALRSAIDHFKAAVKLEPGYALAYAGIADAYTVLPLYGPSKGEEVWPLAMNAADRAIALDSTLAEGYAARGNLQDAAWRWADAERDLRRAISLRPNYAQAHQWLGENLMVNDRIGESVTELKRATELDPTSPIALGSYALALGVAGDSASAFVQAKKAVDLDPSLYATRFMLGAVKVYAGRYGDAIRELEAADALSKGLDPVRGMLGYAYAKAGDRARATGIVSALEMSKVPDGFAIARIYIGLGDNAKALRWFERAASQHNGYFQSESLHSPIFEPLRGDPMFRKIVHSIGLEI